MATTLCNLLPGLVFVLSTTATVASVSAAPLTSPLPQSDLRPAETVRILKLDLSQAENEDLNGDASLADSKASILYLNMDGGMVRASDSKDSSQNADVAGTHYIATSFVLKTNAYVPAWTASDETRAQLVACVKDVLSPYNVDVVTEDPGAVPHKESIIGGFPQDVGQREGVAGVAPMNAKCGNIPNAPSFAFAEISAHRNVDELCATVLQEWAHTYGLDHVLLASDPMTYLSYNGRRHFSNQAVSCGEREERKCGYPEDGHVCYDGGKQNSHQQLVSRLGMRAGHEQPELIPTEFDELSSEDGEISEQSGCNTGGDINLAAELVIGLAAMWAARKRDR